MISNLKEFESRRTSSHLCLKPRTLNDKQWSVEKEESVSERAYFFHSEKQDERIGKLSHSDKICLNNIKSKKEKLHLAHFKKKDLSDNLEGKVQGKKGLRKEISSLKL